MSSHEMVPPSTHSCPDKKNQDSLLQQYHAIWNTFTAAHQFAHAVHSSIALPTRELSGSPQKGRTLSFATRS